MKVKEVTLGMSYTYQPAPYHSIRGEAAFTVTLEEGDDLTEVEEEVAERVLHAVVCNLAGVDAVHTKLYKGGVDPKDLLVEDKEEEAEKWLEDDDEWNA